MKKILDIEIYETGDGGDLHLENGDFHTINGLSNQVYLALFGGNTEESTSEELDDAEDRKDWWGNEYLDEENQFNSSFERTLMNVALTSAGISKLENAAKEDLEYLEEYADITVEGYLVQKDRFELDVILEQPDSSSTKIKFIWDGTKQEIFEQETI